MKVLRVGFVGLRADDPGEMAWFFHDVLGLPLAAADDGVVAASLPTGEYEFVSAFPRDYRDDRRLPNDVDFMVAFVVDDLEQALAEVKAAGLRVVAPGPEVVRPSQEFGAPQPPEKGWFYVRAPDNRVYGFMQSPG